MVRTAVDREYVRATRISLITALVAGLLVFAIWIVFRNKPAPPMPQRRLTDVQVDWMCNRNPDHVMRATGGYDPVPCARCGGLCYIRLTYQCPVHGEQFDALVKIASDPAPTGSHQQPTERVIAYRYLDGPGTWQEANGFVPCPVPGCGQRARRPRPPWRARGEVTSKP